MRIVRSGTTAACLFASTPGVSLAERAPDPDASIAGMIALSERCESELPSMHDATGKLWQSLEADCHANRDRSLAWRSFVVEGVAR